MKFPVACLFSILFCGIYAARLNTNWWQNIEIYDIVVQAYKDLDGDGFGDFEGIISKLDYIKSLGANAIKLSSIFASSEMISNKYPIEDFQNIHVGIGSLEYFDKLVEEAKGRGIRIILDLIINHCSREHEWFKKSQRRIEPYTDYFIWSNKELNDTITGPSAFNVWKFDTIRQEYYYCYFDETIPDLNLKNKAVQKEIENIMKFWLDRGVSGFNLLFANVYVENVEAFEYKYPPLELLEDTPESYKFVHELRKYIDDYNHKRGGDERVLILEQRPIEKFPNLRGDKTYPIAHIVSHNLFRNDRYHEYKSYFKSSFLNETITNVMKELECGPTMLILEDSRTELRTPNRFRDRQYLDIWLTTVYMLPGIINIYYGQEIGISTWRFGDMLRVSVMQPDLPIWESKDIVKVTAMQWDESINAGFTSSELSFYSPNVDYWKINVENFINAERSTLKSTQSLLKLRNTKAAQHGDVKTYIISEYIFAFSRSYLDQEHFLTIINLSNKMYTFNLKRDVPEFTPQEGQIVSSSVNSIYLPGYPVDQESQLSMRPVSTVVISFTK